VVSHPLFHSGKDAVVVLGEIAHACHVQPHLLSANQTRTNGTHHYLHIRGFHLKTDPREEEQNEGENQLCGNSLSVSIVHRTAIPSEFVEFTMCGGVE
jgi:hypothetical protein